jgi:hypothetical protein
LPQWSFVPEEKFMGSKKKTALSRTIEIDLREMLDESNIPPPLVAVNDI